MHTAPGNDNARVHTVRVLDAAGRLATKPDINSPVTIEVEYRTLVPDIALNVAISLFSEEGIYVLSSPSITDALWYQRPHPTGLFRSRCTIPAQLLNQGCYKVTVLLVENGYNIIVKLDEVVSLDMTDLGEHRGGYFGLWGGVVRPQLTWTTGHLQ